MGVILKLAGESKKNDLPRKEKDPFLPDKSAGAANPAEEARVGNGRKILVVDDNPVVLKSFELKLKASGFDVATTWNAAEVASSAEKAGSEIIILDVNFPPTVGFEWDGFAVVEWLRHFPELARIPVILISGEESAKYKEKALAAGAVAFFQKPVPYPELLATILQALGVKS